MPHEPQVGMPAEWLRRAKRNLIRAQQPRPEGVCWEDLCFDAQQVTEEEYQNAPHSLHARLAHGHLGRVARCIAHHHTYIVAVVAIVGIILAWRAPRLISGYNVTIIVRLMSLGAVSLSGP